MEQVVVSLLVGLVQAIPKVIEVIEKSGQMSPEEKTAILNHIQDELDAASTKVMAVRFKDVDATKG